MNSSLLTLPTMGVLGGGRALLSILALIVSEPIHPADRAAIGEWPGANKLAIWSRAVGVSGGFAYVANESLNHLVDGDRLAGERNEMAVLDIRDPAHPVRIGGFATGMEVLDVSDSTHPVKIGEFDTNYVADGEDIHLEGKTAYFASGLDGLQILNLHLLRTTRASASVKTQSGRPCNSAVCRARPICLKRRPTYRRPTGRRSRQTPSPPTRSP